MGIGTTIAFLLVSFTVSALIAYALTEMRARKRCTPPEVGTTLRLRAASGMYRSKLLAVDSSGWKISAPLSRNNYVPLRVDEVLTVEAPVPGGVYLFKTAVIGRDGETHELTLQAPLNVAPQDRRAVRRCSRDSAVTLDGVRGVLVDISPLGARLKTEHHVAPGDRVRLDLPEGRMYAWVLDSWPTRHGDEWRENVRLRFEATHERACV